jgi:PKD repeat protein
MNKAILLFALLHVLSGPVTSQISQGGSPYSMSLAQLKSAAELPRFTLKSMDTTRLLAEDVLNPSPARYGILEDVVINVKYSGRAEEPGDISGKIWRYRVEGGMAKSIQLKFKKFVIPEGARLYLYNDSYTQIAGAYTKQNVRENALFVLADFQGNHVNIEYFEPDNPEFEGEVILGSVGQAYKDIFQLKNGESYTNINCPEGKNLQLSKHAVCKLTFQSDGSSYLCSGALVNNVRQDGTPYFLTANHCISDSAEASTLVAYFNYENEGCDGAASTPLTLSGAGFLTSGTASDYTLLLLEDEPPSPYQPYFAGWNANDAASVGAACVHHPVGLTKKLSLDFDSIGANEIPVQWEGNTLSPVGSHWLVNFDIGLTSGGSSGSPLFNSEQQIIGQLHGGDDTYDLYGKFSYSYTHPSGGNPALKVFLDVDDTGIKSLGGFIPPGNPPDVFFALPSVKVCLDAPVIFKDYSVFAPFDLAWTITPSTFVFAGGTSAESPDPIVRFLEEGFYTVKLTATNTAGTDSMIRKNVMLAGNTIQVGVNSFPEDEICDCDFTSFRLTAEGAQDYSWSLIPPAAERVTLSASSGDTVIIFRIPDIPVDSSYLVDVRVVGSHGTCIDTTLVSYQVIRQFNDNIANAYILDYGTSATFSNHCATVETGEPVPPFYSCTTQYSWCDEYGTGENIVENSVWFKFLADDAGLISISSTGIDNQLALYEADSYSDILQDNYIILAANDDRTSQDANPLIRSESVQPGKIYWIQVDGSGGGVEGEFYLNLTALATGLTSQEQINLRVYPQPASDLIYIEGDAVLGREVEVTIYTTSGTEIFKDVYYSHDGVIKLECHTWDPGVYIVTAKTNNVIFTARIVKY